MIVLSPGQMQKTEQRSVYKGISIMKLMENASERVCEAAWQMAGGGPVLFLCGQGNNGGDGFGAACRYHHRGGKAVVVCIGDMQRLESQARSNQQKAKELGIMGSMQDCEPVLVVDALFGTGLTRAPRGEFAQAISWINEQTAPVLSVDIPSGVDARDGTCPGVAVRATRTVVFHAYKTGNVLLPGRALCGQMELCSIGIPEECQGKITARVMDDEEAARLYPSRPMASSKHTFGHALLIAGARGMAGAAALCAQGALHMGAGLVSVACCGQSVMPIVQTLAPCAMCLPMPEEEGMLSEDCAQVIRQACNFKGSVALGPGLGRSPGARAALEAALEAHGPLVIDADGLNLLSEDLSLLSRRAAPTVLTPHLFEMARLQGRDVGNPIQDATGLAKRTGAVVLLKGPSTVIASPEEAVAVNLSGTPAMARGGSGDVLTGFIAALLAQGLTAFDAARLGAYLHGLAGEEAQRRHSFAMTAADLPLSLGAVFQRILG